jgi:hypothetical protein
MWRSLPSSKLNTQTRIKEQLMGFMDGVKKAGRMMVMGELDVANEMRAHKSLMSKGVAHDAECTSLKLGWDREEDGDPRWGASEMVLVVDPDAEARSWSGSVWIRSELAKRIAPDLDLGGHRLVVRVDPADAEKLTVDWDASAAGAPVG